MPRPDILHAEPTPRGDTRSLRRALVFAFARPGNEDTLLDACGLSELADSRWQPACFAQDLFLAELLESCQKVNAQNQLFEIDRKHLRELMVKHELVAR